MDAIERDLFNRLLILSAAISEMIELEEQMVAELNESADSLAGRKEFLSFWLRTQSFFVSAKSLTDSKQLKSLYDKKIKKDWRLGIKALRHFFAHEIRLIPSLHTSVRFIPEESLSTSLEGFVIGIDDAKHILKGCVKNSVRREVGRLKEKGLSSVKRVYRKHLITLSQVLNDWRSKPNRNVVVISDIATNHYLTVCSLLGVINSKSKENRFELAEKTAMYDSGIMPIRDKIKSIEETVHKVQSYRARNFNWIR